MKKLVLKDLLEEKDINELKEKMPLLPKAKQRIMIVLLESKLHDIIRVNFPDIRKKFRCSRRILKKELSFAYLS